MVERQRGCTKTIIFRNARVLVVTTTATRRDRLWETIEQVGSDIGLGPEIMERFWIAEKGELEASDLRAELWRVPGVEGTQALVDLTQEG